MKHIVKPTVLAGILLIALSLLAQAAPEQCDCPWIAIRPFHGPILVGEQIRVQAAVVNPPSSPHCALVSEARLYIYADGAPQDESAPIFEPVYPAPINLSAGVPPGWISPVATWTLRAVRPGTAEFLVEVWGEAVPNCEGPFVWWWLSGRSRPITVIGRATLAPQLYLPLIHRPDD